MRPLETTAGLAAFNERGAGTDAERRAARWLAGELVASRHRVRIETFWCRPNWALAHAWHVALALAGSLLSVSHPTIGAILLGVALLATLADATVGISPGRRLSPEHASQNVLASHAPTPATPTGAGNHPPDPHRQLRRRTHRADLPRPAPQNGRLAATPDRRSRAGMAGLAVDRDCVAARDRDHPRDADPPGQGSGRPPAAADRRARPRAGAAARGRGRRLRTRCGRQRDRCGHRDRTGRCPRRRSAPQPDRRARAPGRRRRRATWPAQIPPDAQTRAPAPGRDRPRHRGLRRRAAELVGERRTARAAPLRASAASDVRADRRHPASRARRHAGAAGARSRPPGDRDRLPRRSRPRAPVAPANRHPERNRPASSSTARSSSD